MAGAAPLDLSGGPPLTLTYPPAFTAADEASLSAQRRFLAATRGQLILVVAAGVIGAFTWRSGTYDFAAFLVAALFVLTALVRWRLARSALVERWHDGRAGAESVKTLAWRYAVGGNPFGVEDDCVEAFRMRATEVLDGLPRLRLPDAGSGALPTDEMRRLRSATFDERRDAYLGDRVIEQQRWYAEKARWNTRRARGWASVIVMLQMAAASGALLRGFGLVRLDAFGIAAAVIGAATAWLATKQHDALAASYSVAAQELGAIASQWSGGEETAWADFVADAEEAISREHTMWLATARVRKPVDIA